MKIIKFLLEAYSTPHISLEGRLHLLQLLCHRREGDAALVLLNAHSKRKSSVTGRIPLLRSTG